MGLSGTFHHSRASVPEWDKSITLLLLLHSLQLSILFRAIMLVIGFYTFMLHWMSLQFFFSLFSFFAGVLEDVFAVFISHIRKKLFFFSFFFSVYWSYSYLLCTATAEGIKSKHYNLLLSIRPKTGPLMNLMTGARVIHARGRWAGAENDGTRQQRLGRTLSGNQNCSIIKREGKISSGCENETIPCEDVFLSKWLSAI